MSHIVDPRLVNMTDSKLRRFHDKYRRGTDDECWEWTAAKDKRGYGRFAVVGSSTMLAHRISFYLAYGWLLPDHVVAHKCDNPSCVNPRHLFHTKQAGNLRDAAEKGRMQRGEDRWNAKLNETYVRMIRSLSEEYGFTSRQLAWLFGVKQGHINDIIARRRWTYVN